MHDNAHFLSLYSVVDVEPLRMMIHLLGEQCHSHHESERLVEVAKLELLDDRVTIRRLRPAIRQQRLEMRRALALIQCLRSVV